MTVREMLDKLKLLYYRIRGKKLIGWDISSGGDYSVKMTAYWLNGIMYISKMEYLDNGS